MSDNIKVVVKIRPLISREIEAKLSYQWRVNNNTINQLDQYGKEYGSGFTFDKVYDKETKTSDIYNDIAKPIVEAAIAGINGTIFAYGQTSSGKTYTMTGTEDSPGIIPLSIFDLFQNIKNIPDRDFLVRVSYIEIYNETLKDLLNVDNKVKVFETLQGVKVDCTEQVTSSPDEVLRYLKQGEANRQTGATNMNEESSRSHSIFQITIESREHIEGGNEEGCVNVSQLNLVDLAGSERAGQTGATGIRFKEGTHINKSLSTLALVIKQLSEDQTKHVSYRDSKLTRILQNSLGGNAKTSIICAVTPASVEETISTLQFANRAKAIKNEPKVNAVATDASMIQSLTKQLSILQSELESKKNLEVMLENKKNVEHNLQKQIAALQRLILNGFETRRSLDMMSGARRKLPPPRRVTISTLHPIDEDPVPAVPKFHTPLLKYNPMVIPGSNDFVPIQNANKLSSLPEEGDNRLITPPPPDKKISINDEIIELDSDDDVCPLDVQTCSPYHNCYGSSKTPPCILRKNAKMAEKSLKDIVELTEREKIYTPSVIELIEKLEQNTTVISRLEDEVGALNKKGKEKDLEIEQLRVKVSKSLDEIKSVNSAKVELEALCKEYTTKLTDWEVSYETLKSKTKMREDELLSLLEEQKKYSRQVEDNDKKLISNLDKGLNFMDMSKDISLVNSDNESSMTNLNDETSSQVQDLVVDIQNQLTSKNQSVLELEADLLSHKQNILHLENCCKELQRTLDGYKNEIDLLKNENSSLKSTVDTLNSTIKSQKTSLESATNDIDSYNSLIQELQIKLTDKEKLTTFNINDNTLEKIIANEEKFIANNENMKNILHSFKIALESRNMEIETLKSAAENNSQLLNCNELEEQLALKEKEINKLQEEAKQLQREFNDNVSMIDKLVQEKTYLKDIEKQLTAQLGDITERYSQLEMKNNENQSQVASLTENVEKLVQSLSEKDNIEKELMSKHDNTIQNIELLNKKILNLEEDIKRKDNVIVSLNTQDTQSQDYILRAKSVLSVLFNVIAKFNGNSNELPELTGDLSSIFNSLIGNLNCLECIITEILSQKDSEILKQQELKNCLEKSNESLAAEVTNLRLNIEECHQTVKNHQEEISSFINAKENLRKELDSIMVINADLNAKMKDLEEKYDNLYAECLSKDDTILSLKQYENHFITEIDSLKQEHAQRIDEFQRQITSYTNDFKVKEHESLNILREKETTITDLKNSVTQLQNHLQEKTVEVENLRQNSNESIEQSKSLLDNILKQVLEMVSSSNIDFHIDTNASTYDNIVIALKSVSINENTDNELLTTQEKVKKLSSQNHELSNSVTEITKQNKALLTQFEEIKFENTNLNRQLNDGNEILSDLRHELNQKITELDDMVIKTRELKDHFSELDNVMKEQINDLQPENYNIKARCSELVIRSDLKERDDTMSLNTETEFDNETVANKPCDSVQTVQNNSPPSLLTICCNKIIDAIQPDEKSTSPSDSNTSVECSVNNLSVRCDCDILRVDLKSAQMENEKLMKAIEHLKSLNQQLISEQEQVRTEVQLLLQPAYELQKKINSHKTNLSTLTATTYAENKSLRSQVKVLQHHHSRFHKVCQRDLPVVKKQLNELMTILKGESSISHNVSFKRYSLPSVLLDNSSTINNLKNESTLDGDLLMLDTNLTMTTSADNTLMGLDQTCLDMTQVYTNNDVGCQTLDSTHYVTDGNQIEGLFDNNIKLLDKIEALVKENNYLKQQVDKDAITRDFIDAQSSPIKIACTQLQVCKECENLKRKEKTLEEEIMTLSQRLSNVVDEKKDIEKKYYDITLEIPSTEALLKRITIFEKELNGKVEEINKLKNTLNNKNETLKQLQQENDSLSTQVMENISETDDLNKELEVIKDAYEKVTEKCRNLELQLTKTTESNQERGDCLQCCAKNDNQIVNIELHSKLNRSLSDSDTSTRYNKICTLQNELHAGREDCKELSEEVTVIKKHLECSNLSMGQNMDLDESMCEPNIFSFSKHFDNVGNKFSLSNTAQDLDIYSVEKLDCVNFFVEKTGADKENLDCNIKIIDVMKMFYTNCIMRHHNEVENLVNKIKCFEESRNQLEQHIKELSAEYTSVTKKLEEKENNFQLVSNTLSQIRKNTLLIKEEMSENFQYDNSSKFMTIFVENFLKIVDNEFGFSSVSVFKSLVDNIMSKNGNDVTNTLDKYNKLQEDMERTSKELSSVNENLLQLKCLLSEKENECKLLKAQNEKIHEISSAVTLDIVKKEQELCQTIVSGCKKLVENNILSSADIDTTLPLESIKILFEHLVKEYKNKNADMEEKHEILALEIKNSRTKLEEIQTASEMLKVENDKLKETIRTLTLDLNVRDTKLQTQSSLHEELNKKYNNLIQENESCSISLAKQDEEIKVLRQTVLEKEIALQNLQSSKNTQEESKISELLSTVESYREEIANLKIINEVIVKEKESAALELDKSKELLRINTAELDKMTADILVLRESVKDNLSIIETLKEEAKSLLQQNITLKEQFDVKCRDCSRLEMNIKTHEKTAEIQSKMIIRHQKQKEEDDKTIAEKDTQLEELALQLSNLRKEYDILKSNISATKQQSDGIKIETEDLEFRLSHMESDFEKVNKPRPSVDTPLDTTRRRRQSIHDSKRMFSENEDLLDNNKVAAVFESRAKPADLFMDVDEDHSNRSTPVRNSRGRDSLHSRHDQSDEPVSRPSSVAETRRRRQSSHDMRRSGVQQTPSPHEWPSNKLSASTNRKSVESDNNNVQSELSQLREKLSSCQQELEDLKEQYRELDEECETCAQYLQERDEQCRRLKKEKTDLEKIVTELQEKLQSVNPNQSKQEQKSSVCHAAVNTDEDWANLHSIVVDRMSFDAEVEKNKRLTKTIEELRLQKQDLKMTIAKMQKALEKSSTRDYSRELEAAKSELRTCKQELKELREKYRELDEECETCSTYLQERDEQVRKLKEAKAALEAKLQEYAEKSGNVSLSLRRKRRSLHDQARPRAGHAATQVSDDLLSYQVERDDTKNRNDDKAKEIKYLKSTVEKLSQQKASLEQQWASASAASALVVATGSAIVQNQQLSDVMKENQKLKKINSKLIEICKKRGKKPELAEDMSLGQ